MIICANIKSIKQNKISDGWLSMKKREKNPYFEKKMAAAIFWPAKTNRYMYIYFGNKKKNVHLFCSENIEFMMIKC